MAADNYIIVSSTASSVGAKTIQLVNLLRQAQNLASEVNDIYQQAVQDPTAFAALLGVNGDNSTAVYNLEVGALADIMSGAVSQFVDRVGG